MPPIIDTPTQSCTSSLGLTDTIDLSDDALFFRAPRPSTVDLPSPPTSPNPSGYATPSPPRPPRRQSKTPRKVPRKPVPLFFENGALSDTTPPLSTTPSTSSELSHQSHNTGDRSQVSLDITRPTHKSSLGYFDLAQPIGTITPSSRSTLSSLDIELAQSTYQRLACPSPTPEGPRRNSLHAPSNKSRRSSSASLPALVNGPADRVDNASSTLLSSPGVRPRGDGWTGGPQRESPKPWYSRARGLSNGSRDKPSIYGVGMGIEHVKQMGRSHPNLPSMTNSRLDLLPPTRAPNSSDLSGVNTSPNSGSSIIAVENVGAPEMSRSGTFGTKTKIHLIKSRPEIPARIRRMSSPRRTEFGTTYDFRESVLSFESQLQANLATRTDHKVDRNKDHMTDHKPLAVLGKLKAKMKSASAARPTTPATRSIGQPVPVEFNQSSFGAAPPTPPTSRPASRLGGATSTWKSTFPKLKIDKWNRRLSLARPETPSLPPRAPTPPSPRSLAVVSMSEFLSTTPSFQPSLHPLSLSLAPISESIDLDDILDQDRRESIVSSLLTSGSSSRRSSLPPALDSASPSVQSEHDTPLITPTLTEQPVYHPMSNKVVSFPINPHLRPISRDSIDSKGIFYTSMEGEDVSMIHFEEPRVQ